ncbi:MAG: hypothetical protein EA369_09685 [Bradymonadales bacterium]|nr:MAG: hypothetical protein EA369_09685 [Bradymonadales bacterium]
MKIEDLGEFFMGQRGLEKISALSQKLYTQIRQECENELGCEFSYYHPGMALLGKREALKKLYWMSEAPDVESRPEALELYRKAIETESDFLSALHFDSPFKNRRIATGCSTDTRAFYERMREAKQFLLTSHPLLAKRYSALVYSIVPLEALEDSNDRTGVSGTHRSGASSKLLRGAILHVLPCFPEIEFWKIDLAVDYAHEVGHQALDVYLAADRILSSPYEEPVYSPIRKVNRPAIMSLHANAALAYIVEAILYFRNRQDLSDSEQDYLLSEHKKFLTDINDGIAAMEDSSVRWTPLGQLIFDELRTTRDLTERLC